MNTKNARSPVNAESNQPSPTMKTDTPTARQVEHTPKPWRVNSSIRRSSVSVEYTPTEIPSGLPVCYMEGGIDMMLANAAFIVTACNEHAALTAEVARLRAALEEIVQFDALTYDMECRGMKDKARAALAPTSRQ